MILCGSALSDPDRHNHENLPIVLAGRSGGKIKTGRHVKDNNAFRTKREVPLSNLLLSMLDRMGVDVDHFGTATAKQRISTGSALLSGNGTPGKCTRSFRV
jgi:hypothetical protein